ncbi:MAG: YciI family protein [Gemmatimonadales bacterium]
MKYLCAIYYDEKRLDDVPKEAVDAVVSECLAYDESLKRNGHLLACERLQPVSMATTVRIRNGQATVTDGPFAETKEQLGGFYLIEARDLNDAIRIASQIPPGRLGCVEVRPVLEYGT